MGRKFSIFNIALIFVQKENNALCHMYINKIIFLLLNQLMFVKFPWFHSEFL